MSLSGVNKLCAQCIQECKQWQQVKVVNCSFFKSRQQQSAKLKNRLPYKHGKIDRRPVERRFLGNNTKPPYRVMPASIHGTEISL